MFEKLDLTGLPNRYVDDSHKNKDSYILANEQEQFVVDRLRQTYPEIAWYTTTEFMGGMDPEQNRILGDIVGVRIEKSDPRDRKPSCFIDLKCTRSGVAKTMYGSPMLSSIVGFATNQTPRHYFLCTNVDGSDFIIVDAWHVLNMVKTEKCLYATKYTRIPDKRYDFCVLNFAYKPKSAIGVAGNDFVRGADLKKLNLRNGKRYPPYDAEIEWISSETIIHNTKDVEWKTDENGEIITNSLR